MKFRTKLVVFLIFLLPSAALPQAVSGYKYYREITPVEGNGYYRIPVDAQTIGKSTAAFNDFRVLKIDEADSLEVPYLLSWNESVYRNLWVDQKIINTSYQKKTASYVTVEVGEKQEINAIRLNIVQDDFDKSVTIEGSNDNTHWQTISENIRIVGFARQHFKFNTLYFPESAFAYYRIIFNDKTSDPLTVIGAQTSLNNEIKAEYKKVNDIYVVRKEIKKDEQQVSGRARITDNYTQIKVILPAKVCLSELRLKSRNKKEDFYRNLVVCDTKNRPVYNGTFTSLEREGVTIVPLNKYIGDTLIVKVINNDNLPVESIDVSVFGMNAFILAKLAPEQKYILVYGKRNAQAPEYDLAYFSEKILTGATDINCGSEKILSLEIKTEKKPLLEQRKWLWITLVGLVALLGIFAFTMLRKVNNPK